MRSLEPSEIARYILEIIIIICFALIGSYIVAILRALITLHFTPDKIYEYIILMISK